MRPSCWIRTTTAGWAEAIESLFDPGESGGPARGRPPPRGGLHLGARRRDHGRCLPPGAWRARVSTPDVSVIVLNYNGRQWLKPCLDALAAQQRSTRHSR